MASFPQPTSGCFDGPLHRWALRAFFEDTDLSGVVYHANYLRWFERARSDMLRCLGIDQRAAQEAGQGAYAVAEVHITFRAPARLDDTVLIESRAEEIRAASCRMHQRALRDDSGWTGRCWPRRGCGSALSARTAGRGGSLRPGWRRFAV